MNKKRLIAAFFSMIAFFAFIHIILLIITALITSDLTPLNLFSILGLQFFAPGIEVGMISFIISSIIILIAYFLSYVRSKS